MKYLFSKKYILIAENNELTFFIRLTKEIVAMKLDENESVAEIYSNNHIEPSYFLRTKSGKLYAFGSNKQGQLGIGTKTSYQSKPQLIDDDSIGKIIQVRSGMHHSALLNEHGEVYITGSNQYSQLGQKGGGTCTFQKMDLTQFGPMKRVECGPFFTLALTQNEQLIVWGYSIFGALGENTTNYRIKPSLMDLPQDRGPIVDIVATYHSTTVLTPTQVYRTDDLKLESQHSYKAGLHPIPQLNNQNITRLINGEKFYIAQNAQGRLFGWDKPAGTNIEDIEELKRIDEPTSLPIQAKEIQGTRDEIMILNQDHQLKFYKVNSIGTMEEFSLANKPLQSRLEESVIEHHFKSRSNLLKSELSSSIGRNHFTDLRFFQATEHDESTGINTSDLRLEYGS